ncbi:MAG: 8-oxoguanine DNA glycosylase, N-terminal domain-containing protein, partial [Butyrivibrio sp.]|nr:8-oxoguanine DNA glycosylase, N-terminal domain-containing protein [Butyrivibrio sp.]
MIIKIEDDFDLAKIADSGQCFRFNKCDGGYSVAAGSRHVPVKELGDDRYDFGCDEAEFEDFWRDYFDLDTSYR